MGLSGLGTTLDGIFGFGLPTRARDLRLLNEARPLFAVSRVTVAVRALDG
jgi:hypothetical protein